MKNPIAYIFRNPVFALLCLLLAISPVFRFSWDIGPQTLIHVLIIVAVPLLACFYRLPFRPFHGVLLAFFAAAVFSALGNPCKAAIRGETFVLLDSLAVAYLVSLLPADQKQKLLLVPVLAGFWYAVIIIVYSVTALRGIDLPLEFIVNFNVAAGYLVLCLPLSFLFWRRGLPYPFILTAVLFAAILLTRSRIAVFVSASVLALQVWHYDRSLRKAVLLALPVVATIIALISFMKAGQNALAERVAWATAAWNMFLQNPANGVGWGNYTHLYLAYRPAPGLNTAYAHNIFLQLLAETGIPGLLAFAAVIALFYARRLSAALAEMGKAPAAPEYLAVTGFLAVNLFDYSFYVPAVMMLFFACVGAAFAGDPVLRVKQARVRIVAAAGIAFLACYWPVAVFIASWSHQHGVYYLKNGDLERSELLLANAIRIDPVPHEYYSRLAELHFARYSRSKESASLETSIEMQRRSLERFGESARSWSDLAWLYRAGQQREQAVAAMRRSVRHDPYNASYRRILEDYETENTEGAL